MLSWVPSHPASIAPNTIGGDETLLERIVRNPRIPSPPNLALQVLQKTGQEECTVQEISELLAHDPGLCAKLLGTMNSAMFGRSRPVTNVRQAVTILGNRPLRSLVLGLALPVMQAGFESDAGLRRFWKKSIAGAVMARELAIRRAMPAPDDEMAACLLRDLGMIPLRQTFPDAYRPVWLGEIDLIGEDLCAWEERHVGIDHAEVGATLLERWRLPLEIAEPIRFHHQPRQMPKLIQELQTRALLVEFVTRLTDIEELSHCASRIEGILETAREQYGLERADLEAFLAAVRPKIEEFSRILGVDIGACPDFGELLASGCEEMVRLSVEAATTAALNLRATENTGTVDQSIRGDLRNQFLLDDPGNVASGSRILQYEVVKVLGRGAMGIVLQAYDPGLARHVAIKILAPELVGSGQARQRFALEARFAAALRHEHVVAIYAVHELDDVPFLVMEYVNGSSLADLLDAGRRFSVAEIARIGRQTALGLAAAHEGRLIHRDIKPANILLEANTLHARVADFGLARAIDGDFHLSQPGLLLGTPNFMSPEQVDGKTLTAATDLFSLGSVLYMLCTHALPFRAETMSGLLHAVAEKQPMPIRALNPGVPDDLARVIDRLHAKNPTDRPATAAAVAELLEPWIAFGTQDA